MNDQKYDVIVIGTGPGGEGAAMKAAKEGKVGGGDRETPSGRRRLHPLGHHSRPRRCATPSTGCWNSTPARRSATRSAHALKLSYPDLLRSAESVIARQTAMRRDFYERNRDPALSRPRQISRRPHP
jgi:NAD(P) transhydrogenase